MKTDWEIFQKIMSGIQIVYGLTFISFVIWFMKLGLSQFYELSNKSWENLSYFNLFKIYNFNIIWSLIGIIGGVKWFKNQKSGWLLSILFWILSSYSATLFIVKLNYKKSLSNTDTDVSLLFYLILIISGLFSIILLSKYFRKKYIVERKSILLYISLLILLMIDRFILFLSA